MMSTPEPPEGMFLTNPSAGAFTILPLKMMPEGWEHWDRYQILELLGEGGMGRVFKATDRQLKRFVALKFIRSEDPGLARRLGLEAQIQAGLDHENIVKVYETGEFNGFPYIAMQYIDGATFDLEQKQGLGLRERVAMLVEVARALDTAHQQGLVHRDLKPGNILVERHGERLKPYLTDFGLARLSTAQGQTRTTQVLGTLAYMAPEQADGAHALDARTDVHGLGAVLYECLAGHPPYGGKDGATDVEMLRRLLHEEPVPPSRIDPAVPKDLETIALKCLEKEPHRRYSSAQAFAEEVDRWLNGRPILARPLGVWEEIQKGFHRFKRNRMAYRVTAGAVMGLSLLLGIGGWRLYRERRRSEVTERIGLELVRIDGVARTSILLPAHDVRRDRARIDGLLGRTHQLAASYGSLGQGQASYAEGRAHMALQDYESAKLNLEAAWAAGVRNSDVADALGRTLLQVYQQRLSWLSRETNPTQRARMRERLTRDLREPGLSFLNQATGGTPEEQASRKVLTLMSQERFDAATAELDRFLAQEGEGYTYLQLKAAIERAQYDRLEGLGQHGPQEREHLIASMKALQSALAIGRSDLEGWERLIQVVSQRIYLVAYVPGDDPHAEYEIGLDAARRAMALDPSDFRVWKNLADLHRVMAHAAEGRKEDPTRLLRTAVQAIDQARDRAPSEAEIWVDRAKLYWELALQSVNYHLPSEADLKLAHDSVKQALALEPGNSRALRFFMDVTFDEAQEAYRNGGDIRPAMQEIHAMAQKTLVLDPAAPGVDGLSVISLILSGMCDTDHGVDPLPVLNAAVREAEVFLVTKKNQRESLLLNLSIALHLRARRQWKLGLPWQEDQVAAVQAALRANAIRDFQPQWEALGAAQGARGVFLVWSDEDPRPYLDEGIQTLRHAEVMDPKAPNTLCNSLWLMLAKAECFHRHHQTAGPMMGEIQRHLTRIESLMPREPEMHAFVVKVLESQGEELRLSGKSPLATWKKALDSLRRLEGLNPTFEDLQGVKARLYRRLAEQIQGPEAARYREQAQQLLAQNPLLRREFGSDLHAAKGLARAGWVQPG
jgi:predicted Ser/Thr protein kinase/ribosomal protein S15P/S13E